MKRSLLRSFLLTSLLAVMSNAVFPQPSNGISVYAGHAFSGETLVYEGKLQKLRLGISVAELTFTSIAAPGSTDLLITSEAVSKGTLLRLFKFSFLQRYESTVDLPHFRIMRTTKHDVQKERVRDGEALFDYRERRVTYVETDPKDVNRAPRKIASEITDPVYDMISAIYALRLMPLSVGMRRDLMVSDSGLLYQVPIHVVARERLDTKIGKVWCYLIKPDIFGHGRLIEQKGEMKIWVTEDPRHIPVRAEIDSEVGKIEVKLKSFSKAS